MSEPQTDTPTLPQASRKSQYLDAVASDSALQPTTLGGMMRLAEVISQAKLCPDHLRNDPGSVMMVMAASQQLGIPWFQGLQQAYVLNGKVSFSAAILDAVAQRSKRCKALYLKSVTENEAVMLVQTVDMAEPVEVKYSLEDARAAGLLRDGSNWTKHRKSMLVARARANASRWYFSDATMGLPAIEELEDVTPAPAPLPQAKVAPAPVAPPTAASIMDDLAERSIIEAEVLPTEPEDEAPVPPSPATMFEPPAEPAYNNGLDPEKFTKIVKEQLGAGGPALVRTFMKNKFPGKRLVELTDAEIEKLDDFIAQTAARTASGG